MGVLNIIAKTPHRNPVRTKRQTVNHDSKVDYDVGLKFDH